MELYVGHVIENDDVGQLDSIEENRGKYAYSHIHQATFFYVT